MSKIDTNNKILFFLANYEWLPVVCLTSHSFTEQSNMFDTTTRKNGSWKTQRPDTQNFSISAEGVADTEGVSLGLLKAIKRNELRISWGIGANADNIEDQGLGHVTNLSYSDPVNSFRSFNFEIQGFGEPEDNNTSLQIAEFLNDGQPYEANAIMIGDNTFLINENAVTTD